MSSIVLELQRDALDRNVSITELLRKALVVARKLKIIDFEQWVSQELNGYGDNSEVPKYRMITGQVKAWNPYHGWQPVVINNPDMESTLSQRACGQTIAEIESLIKNKAESDPFQMPFSAEILNMLRKGIKFNTEITLITSHTSLVRILDAVRTIILNWSMKLEEDGILGEGMSFTDHEKSEVAKHSYIVTNVFGNVTGSQIQQGTKDSKQEIGTVSIDTETVKEFLSLLKSKLAEIVFLGDDKAEIEAEVTTIESQVNSLKPKVSIIKESLGTIRRILEGASGSIVAGLLTQLGQLLQ
jgi:hypothetical protein